MLMLMVSQPRLITCNGGREYDNEEERQTNQCSAQFVLLCVLYLVGHGSLLTDGCAPLLRAETHTRVHYGYTRVTEIRVKGQQMSEVTHLAKPMKSSWFVLM